MKKNLSLFVALLCAVSIHAADYTTYLTAERGFTEVTSTSDIITDGYYYILASAEDANFIVGIGPYAAKPGWASEQSKALHYKSADTDPMLDRTNFFTIDWRDEFIALRNVVYSGDAFQTHNEASYMYVNTYTCQGDNVKEWGGLTAVWNDGYWTFEEAKYSGNFLGPWNKYVADGEAIAGNRANVEGDEAGHYRLFRIAKNSVETFYPNAKNEAILSASSSNPVDATFLITNPSFETGDLTGWTVSSYEDPEISAKNSAPTNGEGGYTFNFFQWWASGTVSQTANVPSGIYDISAVVATWDIEQVTFSAGGRSVTNVGQGDMTGIPVSFENIIVGTDNSLTISASGTVDWWSDGHSTDTDWRYACGFFKLDNVQLTCKGLYLSAVAQALPNDETTVLTANQWYYYDAPATGKYTLTGNLLGLVYTDESQTIISEITTHPTKNEMGFETGRVYFKTTRSDATLKVEPAMDINTFTACALNVDGMPKEVKATVLGITAKTITLNTDGPMAEGSKLISQYLANKNYDFIACSEDFNFHSELMSSISNNYSSGTLRASIPDKVEVLTSGTDPTFDTDGLNFIWKNNISTSGESWTQFNALTSTDGNQYIKKGYRYYEVILADGNVIDVFITHMDAGDDAATQSRPDQLQQIANAIISKGNTDRPKIFMGDTNCRWTREDISANFVDILSGTYDVSDVWVELTRNGVYPTPGGGSISEEVVDKIFYINPKGKNKMKLTPISYVRDSENYVKSDGTALGDHAPVVARFNIALDEEVDNTVTPGDIVAGNGTDTTDLEALVNILKGNAQNTYDMNAADLNEDGEITLADLTKLVNLLLQNNQ